MKRAAWWLALVGICAYVLVFVLPVLVRGDEAIAEEKTVLSLWNVDSFEGGKGSRTEFLKGIAARYEKQTGVILLVSSKTEEWVRAAWEQGERPDLLSFGGYAPVEGLSTNAECWCTGKYVVYTKGTAQAMTAQNTVLSIGGNGLVQIAAALYGLQGECQEQPSTTAYVQFLNGKWEYLIGTQRDACRFQSRGATVTATPINAFCDLRQYITAVKEDTKEKSEGFIRYLLTKDSQNLLTAIGMFSDRFSIYSGDTLQAEIERGKTLFSLSPWTNADKRQETLRLARQVMRGENAEVLKNFLKGV